MELEKYRNDQEVSQSFLVNMEAPDVTENHRDYNVRKSLKCSKRASQVENVLSVIFMYNTPYSSAMKNFLSIDFRIYLTTRLCRRRPVGRNTCSAFCCVTHHIYLVKTRTCKHKNMDVLFHRGYINSSLLKSDLKMSESSANVVSFDEDVLTLSNL